LIALAFPHFNDDLFGYIPKGKNVTSIKVAELNRLVQGLNGTKPTISGSVQRLIFVHLNIDSFFAMASFVTMPKTLKIIPNANWLIERAQFCNVFPFFLYSLTLVAVFAYLCFLIALMFPHFNDGSFGNNDKNE
jgi:hypothetical protein